MQIYTKQEEITKQYAHFPDITYLKYIIIHP